MTSSTIVRIAEWLRNLAVWLVRDPDPPYDPKPDIAAALEIVEKSKDAEALLFVAPSVLEEARDRRRGCGIVAGGATGAAIAAAWTVAGFDHVGAAAILVASFYISAALSDGRYRPWGRIVAIVCAIASVVALVCIALETSVRSGPTVFAFVCVVWGTMHRIDRGFASRHADRRPLPVLLFSDRLVCMRAIRIASAADGVETRYAFDRRLHPTTRVDRIEADGRASIVLEDDFGRFDLSDLVAVDAEGNRLGLDFVEEVGRRIDVL